MTLASVACPRCGIVGKARIVFTVRERGGGPVRFAVLTCKRCFHLWSVATEEVTA